MKARGIQKAKPFLFILPVYVLIIVFKYIPFFMAIQKSFYNWNGANLDAFIGLKNYIDIFQDPLFYTSMWNALKAMIAYILISISLPLLAAELVFSLKSAKNQYAIRTAFTVPMVVPGMVTILLWQWIYASEYGILNKVLGVLSLEQLQRPWLGSSATALISIFFIGFPWIGNATLGGMQFLIYFGGLQSISKDLFEVSEIDGINIFQRFFRIDIPLISSQLKLMISLAIINSLQIFEQIIVLTKGGPGTATMVPAVHIYQQAFNYSKMGYSSAIGVVLFLIILVLTYFNQKLLRDTEKID